MIFIFSVQTWIVLSLIGLALGLATVAGFWIAGRVSEARGSARVRRFEAAHRVAKAAAERAAR